VHLFCLVDDRLGAQHKEPLARLYPSEVVTIGVLFALKGVSFRAFERWLRCAGAAQRLTVRVVCARPSTALALPAGCAEAWRAMPPHAEKAEALI
jgi:hypothetical protein